MKTTHPSPATAGRGQPGWPRLILAAAILLLAAGTGDARAQTFQNFQATQDIAFGTVATGQASGTITIDAATGASTTSGGITFFGATVLRAAFSGQGKKANNCIVTLTFPASVPVSGGGGTATLSHFTLSPASVSLQGRQEFSFQVGARLTVPAGAPAATYAGTLTATAVFTNC